MSLLTEQLSSAAQNQLATQIAVFQAWSQTAFGGLEKLIALNFNTAKQSLDNANTATRELFAVKQAQELLDVSRSHGQPQLEKILSYGRELASITSSTRAELWQIVSKQSPAVLTIPTITVATATSAAAPEAKAVPAVATKPAAKKPVVAKPVAAKPIAATKQLTLLAEAEAKPAKTPAKAKPVAKVAEKTPVKTAAKSASKTPAVKAEAKPATIKVETQKATSSPAVVEAKPATATAALPKAPTSAVSTPAASSTSNATTAATEKVSEKKTVSTKKSATKASTTASPAANETTEGTEKKSAVKFPFAATPNLKKAPGFPANNGKPAYKAKSSAATGAKKPVRQ
ncbi:TIGR01841 family phasin [Undibacterium pigrum]|uniref:Phasin family protein n=1 Tax=Undibacterium pigrum TaxID=401470 RepID=A0A318IXB0_9BURK|nr:TIGR01841 family phasin [Undibacterium pigrum]PXX39955.1 phasin family protein [Undibacterium pigrum]